MQPSEAYSVARRSLDVEDYIDILRRHKGWIFGPFLLVLVGTVVGVYMYPDSYESTAIVKIVPQQVPENMVQNAVSNGIIDRINSMAQNVKSRSVLTTIINNLGLYPRERSRTTIDDVVEEMRSKIQINPMVSTGGGGKIQVPAFTVSYSYENRLLAQRVVSDITSRLINENIGQWLNQTYQTAQFMKDELDQAKKELDAVENKLAEFRMQNNGRLPDQVESNMRQLAAASASITYLDTAISRANQDKLTLEGNLRILKDRLAAQKKEPVEAMAMAAAQGQKSERLMEAERDVQRLETLLMQSRQRYKDSHPDVQTALAQLQGAKAKRDEIAKEESAKETTRKDQPAPVRPITILAAREQRDIEENIQKLQIQIQGVETQIEDYSKQLKRANETMRSYQGRIETVPLGEKQYGELLRDRELAKQKYMDLQTKLDKAQMSKEMEDRKQGELLDILDPATLPRDQTEPKRPLIISLGAAFGLLLGVAIAGAREIKDTSLKNLKDVRAYTQMAILGSIPLLENDFVVRRRKRLAWLGWTTACLAATVVMAGSVVYYYATKV